MKTILLAVLVLAAGCISVSAKKAPGVSLSQYHSFAFFPTPSSDDTTSLDRAPAGAAIKQQVTQELLRRGLHEAKPGEPTDLLVASHMKVRPRYDVVDYGPAWGYGWGWYGPYYSTTTDWLEGTVTIDLVDSRTNQVVWRGTASQAVTHPDNPDPMKVAKAVDKVMQKLPPEMPVRM